MSRLGGKVTLEWSPTGDIDRLECWQESLTDAVAAVNFRMAKFKVRSGSEKAASLGAAQNELRYPDKEAVCAADSRAESLILDAQALDPRLVRRASSVRSCEGETACPALLLAGEENPFFQRRRQTTADAASTEPVLVTVSTDSAEIDADALAAFIATVKIVQQFRPVHVVWQGAWLTPDGRAGYVFHCPLVTGDMDFERLAFVINSKLRDRVSFAFMVRRAMQVVGKRWAQAQTPADRSYLPGSVDFVDHAGIAADAESIAARACRWLGWEVPWSARWNEQATATSALCRWDAGEESMRPESTWTAPTDAQRAQWDAEARERAKRDEQNKREEAARRLASV